MRRCAGLIRLTRPVNMLICAISVIAGGSLGGPPLTRLGDLGIQFFSDGPGGLFAWQGRTLMAAVSLSLVLAAGNVFNDVRDIECDRINVPSRPLPAGLVSPRAAGWFAGVLALLGLLAAVPAGLDLFVPALGAVLLLCWYDLALKRVPFAGNVAVALLGGFAFLFGGMAGYAPLEAIVPAVFAFLYHLGREIVKDSADLPGDTAAGIHTVATVHGIRVSGSIAASVLLLLAAAIPVPFAAGWFGLPYLAVMALTVYPLLAYCIIRLFRAKSPEHFAPLSVILKAGMPAGILAVLIGFQWR